MNDLMVVTDRLVIERDGHRYVCRDSIYGGLCIESCITRADTVTIPSTLGGLPVSELGRESFAGLSSARSIICPAHVRSIGEAAFRNCPKLERVVLPLDEEDFKQTWFEGCTALEEVSLPGCTGSVRFNSIRGLHVNRVTLGAGVRDISVPRVSDAYLEGIEVDEDNAWISSDGVCVYDSSGEVLLRCLCRTRRYEVADGCREIAPEAFAYNKVIEEVVLPEGLVAIGAGAFEGSSLRRVSTPGTLRSIGENAFSGCEQLEVMRLEEGLRRIDRHAFRRCTALRSLRIPASVSYLDAYAFEGCAASRDGSIGVEEGNAAYAMDRSGVLYERGAEGLTLLAVTGDVAGSYEVMPGTRKIAARAFQGNAHLTSVTLPEGLVSVGKAAFSGCKSLVRADLPATLESLGDFAFSHTALEKLDIPASLCHIGDEALCIGFEPVVFFGRRLRFGVGVRHMPRPSIPNAHDGTAVSGRFSRPCRFSVDARNGSYRLVSDFVCERLGGDRGKLRALWYAGTGPDVVVPPNVISIAVNALSNAPSSRSLWLHEGLVAEGRHTVRIAHPLESIHILSATGADDCVLHPAPGATGAWAQSHAFEFDQFEPRLLAHDCDEMLARMSRGYERTWRVVDRLAHPRLMDGELRRDLEEEVRAGIEGAVAEFAQRNYLAGARQLVDARLIDGANIGAAVHAACAADGVAVTAFLLEAQHSLAAGDSDVFDDFDI